MHKQLTIPNWSSDTWRWGSDQRYNLITDKSEV